MNEEERQQLISQIAGALPLPKEIESDFAAFTADTVMNGLWSRTGITQRERSMITIAALTALDRPHELEIHLGLGLENGLTRDEVCRGGRGHAHGQEGIRSARREMRRASG